MTPDEIDRIYQMSLQQIDRDRRVLVRREADRQTLIAPSFPAPVTAIIRDMQAMARELGILDLVLEAARLTAPDRVILEKDQQQIHNLLTQAGDRLGGTYEPVTGTDPRD